MATAYIDTSALLAVAFNEREGATVSQQLAEHSRWVSSNLLEAEMRSAFAREGRYHEEVFAPRVEWVLPERPLTQEIAAVLSAGYLKDADLWHLAAALYAVPEMGETTFITLDTRQRAVAQALGFQV